MTSSVFYKFKSQRDPTRIEFDGTGISVFELKREIMVKSGLGDGTDFDLSIFSEDGHDEYQDDTEIVPRSTSVIARRLPATLGRGKGKAARYMTSKIPLHSKNQSRKEQLKQAASKPVIVTNPMAMMDPNMTEDQKMEAMFAAQSQHWSAQQEELAKQTKVHLGGPARKGAAAPDHPPADGYVCYRCGEKGHWIQNCPTNDDPNFENKRRIKRTTGIPRSFLKTVEKPVSLGADDGDGTKQPSGVMVNADGEFVVAEPDKASWEKFQAKTKISAAAQKAAALGEKELQDRGLECSIDMRLFIDPMKTPCCEKTFCNDCITNALIESDFTCPGCQTEGVLIDDLKIDDETSEKIKLYLEEKSVAKKEKERSKSPPTVVESSASAEIKKKSPSPTPVSSSSKKSPEPSKPATKSPPTSIATPNLDKPQPPINPAPLNKKRPADELLENPKIPKGPKAMQQKQAPQMPQNMSGFGGFPNMPFDMSQNYYGNNGFGGVPMPNMMNFPMNQMGMPNPMMMNPMMMGGNFGGGFPNMPMNMYGANNGNGFPGGMNMNMNMNMNMMNGGGMGRGQTPNAQGPPNGQFPNQQQTIFADPLPNEEDAYFRKPVNPHRHQGRQRRARPSDFREV